MPSSEQKAILAHPVDAHGVILAGPGTGKSTTVLQLVARLAEEHPDKPVRVITFTRAATAELVAKIREDGHGLIEPMTVHAFALSVLMRNPGLSGLPEPLRIPDDWEAAELIRPDLSRRLKAAGFKMATPTVVQKLEREMAAGWDRLDPEIVLLSEIDPALRNAYRAAWAAQRTAFGYSLFAEMPFRARELIEDHPDVDLGDLALLVVDEYQDLNRCDIGLIEAVAERDISILAVGDDDQSIYSFRGAAPQGIREFTVTPAFTGAKTYTLSVSYRCGENVLTPARDLIEASPGRPPKPPLRAHSQNPPGTFAYLAFPDENAERRGVVRLIRHLIDEEDIAADKVVVLVRGDFRGTWSGPLRDALTAAGVSAVDVEAAIEPLKSYDARRLLALARIVEDVEDDLAWWALIHLQWGIGPTLPARIADAVVGSAERFNSRLLRLDTAPVPGVTEAVRRKASDLVDAVLRVREIASGIPAPLADDVAGWAGWIRGLAALAEVPVAEDLDALLADVAATVPPDKGLRYFLNQLEPVAKDLALDTPGVAIMSMTRSKGLTRDVAVVMGVEAGIVPSPRATDEEEERRLLYVAMTRARRHLYLTMATARTDRTAFSGGGAAGASRSRSPFFVNTQVRPTNGMQFLRDLGA